MPARDGRPRPPARTFLIWQVFGLENRKYQLQMSMDERQQEIKVHSDVLRAQVREWGHARTAIHTSPHTAMSACHSHLPSHRHERVAFTSPFTPPSTA